MSWRQALKADAIPWLLEPDEPSVRYLALRDLLDRPAGDPDLLAARAAIADSPTVRAILAAQWPDGRWATDEGTYRPKYRATHWQVILLAELGLSRDHPAVQRALEVMAPAIAGIGADDAIEQDEVIWCYSANTIRYLCLYGLGEEPATRRALNQLLRLAGGNRTWACPYNDAPAACLWGAIKVLRAMWALPVTLRSPGVDDLTALAANALLDYDFTAQNVGRTTQGWITDWFAFGFPGFYESDLLEGLEALAALGYGDDLRFRQWLPFVLDQQDEWGRWPLRNSFNGHLIADIETVGQPSKWVTLRALRTLKWAEER
ncbi:MAG: hypothetical protein KKA73_08145 [Chloroflexi bacterium]|nr:hypothetical protein [Chloroflexota bacterium]MBU1747645.1 hypothetical protein [Chloroflexota bacterium]MBU1879243.1 hypothetical protein [Chloroflexota bacterium]